MFDAGFWLLVAFLIFFALVFSKTKNIISSAILKYRQNIVDKIENVELRARDSSERLEKMRNKTAEVQEICRKIVNSAISEADKFENEAKNQVTSYLNFKEKYIEEKIKIFANLRVIELKKSILDGALELVHKYLNEKSKSQGLDLTEFKQISSKENLLNK
jgi:F0F1-type ATP synthase membrane subunit b/b'